MVTDAEMLEVLRAGARAEEVAGAFAAQCDEIVAKRQRVNLGSPAYDAAMAVFDELNQLYYVVAPIFAAYPTPELFVEGNPPGPYGKPPTRLKRYTQFQQVQGSMARVERAFCRAQIWWGRIGPREDGSVEAWTAIARYKADALPQPPTER